LQPYLNFLNEVDDLGRISTELEAIINNKEAPEDEKKRAEFTLKLIELRPLQKKMREEVLQRYLMNKVAL
jgi:hypothetical protein